MHGDNAFNNNEFAEYIKQSHIKFRPVPPRRHSKNPLESKHNIIRSIFLRLNASSDPQIPPELMAYRAIRISNDLYGSDVLSSFELAKGFTKPLDEKDGLNVISNDLIDAHDTIKAKRKLNLILRSNALTEPQVGVGDLVEVFIKRQHEKRGKWSPPRVVLSYDPSSRTITVPGSHGKTISSAIEDTRFAIQDNPLAIQIQQSIDQIDAELEHVTDCTDENPDADEREFEHDKSPPFHHEYSTSECEPSLPRTGDCVDIFWPLDNSYYSGTVQSIDEDGKHNIEYDDGEDEVLYMREETWRFSTCKTTLNLSLLKAHN